MARKIYTQEEKLALMKKSVSEITPEELAALRVPLGGPGFPYPMTRIEENTAGLLEGKVGVIQTFEDPFSAYSFLSKERVVMDYVREMMTPSMMHLLRDVLLCTAPDSQKFAITIFGEAASGKSHLIRLASRMVHPEGAMVVDCGGMNMRELFWRTVIDYGQGTKEQLDQRLAKGTLPQSCIDLIKAEFPNAIVEKDGKAQIIWDFIGERKREMKPQADGSSALETVESSNEATARAKAVLEMVYTKAGIDRQSSSFGIKNVPGVIFESYWSGRPLFLDEFNKAKPGTLDTFQTYLEFVNGQEHNEKWTGRNPMPSSDDSTPSEVTLYRKDRKIGYFIGISGNDKTDGASTQDLTASMKSRLNIKYIDMPTKDDWKHRISQILTGLPLSTLYTLRAHDAQNKGGEFASWLSDVRTRGLTPEEKRAIPPEQIDWLQHPTNTKDAVDILVGLCELCQQLSNPSSAIYSGPQASVYRECESEITRRGDRIAFTFRKMIDLIQDAKKIVPEVVPASQGAWTFDLDDYFKRVEEAALGKTATVMEKFSGNLVRVILEEIANATAGMPKTQAVLTNYCRTNGIAQWTPEMADNTPDAKNLVRLLNCDDYTQYGGADLLKRTRGLITGVLRSRYDDIGASDESIVPLRVMGPIIKKVKEAVEPDECRFVIPNEDLDGVTAKPLVEGLALATYYLDFGDQDFAPAQPGGEAPEPSFGKSREAEEYQLVDYRTALAGLAMPGFAQQNLDKIWPVHMVETLQNVPEEEKKQKEIYFKILTGRSDIGLDLSILKVADSQGEETGMYLIRDKVAGKSLVVANENISDGLKVQLSKNNIDFVWNADPEMITLKKKILDEETAVQHEVQVETGVSAQLVNQFLSAAARIRVEKEEDDVEVTQQAVADMMRAFSIVNRLPGAPRDGLVSVEVQTTLGEVLYSSKKPKPSVYTGIIRKRG